MIPAFNSVISCLISVRVSIYKSVAIIEWRRQDDSTADDLRPLPARIQPFIIGGWQPAPPGVRWTNCGFNFPLSIALNTAAISTPITSDLPLLPQGWEQEEGGGGGGGGGGGREGVLTPPSTPTPPGFAMIVSSRSD